MLYFFKQISGLWKVPWQRTLAIIFFAELMSAVGFSSIFPFLPLYVESLGSTTGISTEFLAGLVFSAQAFTMMLASPFWGALADRYGRKVMVERATFGGVIVLLLMAFVRSGEELVFLRALQGLITGTVAAANALVASVVPRDRLGIAMGTLQVGQGAGVALGPVIGGLIADLYGYNYAFFVTAAMLFLAGVLVFFGIKENPLIKEEARQQKVSFVSRWRHVIQSPGVPATYGLRFLTQLGRMMIIPIAPLFVKQLLSNDPRVNTFTGLVIGVPAGATILSSFFLGSLGDRIGHRRVFIMSAVCASAIYLPQAGVSHGWQLLALQALVGITMGGIIPAISALLARYTQAGEEGAVYGLDNSINASARSIAPMIGSGIAVLFGIRATFSATAVIFFLTTLFATLYLPKVPSRKLSAPQG
jgi:MFS transporter, DHA1 family, multidrug resistance protein